MVTASRDGMARVWPADGKGEESVLRGHTDAVISAAFSPDGSHLVTASRDGTARYWRVSWPTLLDYFKHVTNACLSPAQREYFLNEKPAIALDHAAACERRFGRPGRANLSARRLYRIPAERANDYGQFIGLRRSL